MCEQMTMVELNNIHATCTEPTRLLKEHYRANKNACGAAAIIPCLNNSYKYS